MGDLRFTIERWIGGGRGAPEETVTRGLLRIDVDGICLTRHDDTWSRSTADSVHVSMYPAARWLAGNWWRLCCEAPPPEGRPRYDWRAAHELGAAGRGYLWPRLSIGSDGECVTLDSTSSAAGTIEPIRYLTTASIPVPRPAFERAAAEFVDTVVARLRATSVDNTDLEGLWRDVAAERVDTTIARQRRYEAMLRRDLDEADPRALAALDGLSRASGLEAAAELAGVLPADDIDGAVRRLEEFSATGVGALARWGPAMRASLNSCRVIATDRARPPWRRGLDAARALRQTWGRGNEPLATPELEDRLGLDHGKLESPSGLEWLPAGLAVDRDDDIKFLLRARGRRARRFEAARLLGDLLGAPAEDAWHPATALYTARQKFQRAFAAEFLCPAEGLRAALGEDRSEDAIHDAAERFGVSERAVEHQIENNLDR